MLHLLKSLLGAEGVVDFGVQVGQGMLQDNSRAFQIQEMAIKSEQSHIGADRPSGCLSELLWR